MPLVLIFVIISENPPNFFYNKEIFLILLRININFDKINMLNIRRSFMKRIFAVCIVLILIFSIQHALNVDLENLSENPIIQVKNTKLINPEGKTLVERIKVPKEFERIQTQTNSFGYYLQNLPLKPHGSKVKYYDGRTKHNDVYDAVVDMDIGDKNLQQCADAVIRLYAEYLYEQKRYDDIHFNFTNGFRADYSKWIQGYRISVNNNDVKWVKQTGNSSDYNTFRKYLDMVFTYAGTLSLSQELETVRVDDMEIGDVFIQGGSPGHCIIVVDMAENKSTGEKLFMVAQSYMPAQDIQILKNPNSEQLSPWYSLNFGEKLITPEWTFNKGDLKRFSGT